MRKRLIWEDQGRLTANAATQLRCSSSKNTLGCAIDALNLEGNTEATADIRLKIMKTYIATYRKGITFQFQAKDLLAAMNEAKAYGKRVRIGEPSEVLIYFKKKVDCMG